MLGKTTEKETLNTIGKLVNGFINQTLEKLEETIELDFADDSIKST